MIKIGKRKVKVVEKEDDDLNKIMKHNEIIIRKTLDIYEHTCRIGLVKTADNYHTYLKHLCAIQRVLEIESTKSRQKDIKSNVPTYILSSRKAREIYESLMDDTENETFVYSTGVIDKTTNTYIPTEVLAPKMAERGPAHARGDQRSINDLLCSLDENSHTILLKCQRHPGTGLSAISPSNVDLRTHRDLEACYPVVGAIFVRDGHFRFFSAGRKFKIEIYGKGVRRIDDRTFCFQN